MAEGFLLARVLLRFGDDSQEILGNLSAIAHTPDGKLWVACDEFRQLECLSPVEPLIFGSHQSIAVDQFIELPNKKDEIDLEGFDFEDGYLWFVGSHSTKRKKPKGKDINQDLERLATITTEANRFVLGRIAVVEGKLIPENAAKLEMKDNQSTLMIALDQDPHLKPFIKSGIPSKDNGLDIEGLAVRKDRVFLGLRGPVLRGLAIILELKLEVKESGILQLKPIGKNGEVYQKHFLDLDGLGIRDICFQGSDLLILAGPTMDLDGALRLFRWKQALACENCLVLPQSSDQLQALFDLPYHVGSDRAEGIVLYPCLDQSEALLVVYDTPHPSRQPEPNTVYADVFRIP